MKKKQNHKHKLIRGVAALFQAAAVSFLLMSSVSRADNNTDIDELKERISEKQGQLGNLESEKKELVAGRTNIQNVIKGLENKKSEMSSYVTALDTQVTAIQTKMDDLAEEISIKEADITRTLAELAAAENVQLEQYEAMKTRIRFMYEQGNQTYMDMLGKAEGFGDMLNKMDYIQSLSDYDKRKLEEYTLIVQEVELTKDLLEEEQALLEEARNEAEAEEENLNALIAEKEKQIATYSAEISQQEEVVEAYDEEIEEQNRIIASIEAQIKADKEALDEAQRMHYNGGQFCWPAPDYTRISSPFGYRIHPIFKTKKLHNGVDMAAPAGSPILAAYDGKVVAAAYSSSMGNYVMLDHGDGVITIYMHASKLYVSKGETVTKGQKIAAVGTTGNSTGNHLHFSVRINGSYVDPMGYL